MLLTSLPILNTQRLLLRPWKESDFPLFAEINADPNVMEFYTNILNREESDAVVKKIQLHIEGRGYGFWAVELPCISSFIGYIGLNFWDLEAKFSPCIDVGWRLSSSHWGKGYATEGAKAVLQYGFESLQLGEIVAMATVNNWKSRKVMDRLGMTYDSEQDFHHPRVPKEHPLSLRVLYRLSRENWCQR